MTTTKCLMLFEDIITVYSEKYTKPINRVCWQNAELLVLK
jgi:hypothetical protein